MALDSLPVLVVIGAGGIGLATAHRLGANHHILLASRSASTITSAADSLKQAGHKVTTQQVDVSSYESVALVARKAASLGGDIATVVLTSAIAPSSSTARQICRVDILGTANVIAAFGTEVEMPRGSSLVCIGSMAQHMAPALSPEQEAHFATAPLEELMSGPCDDVAIGEAGIAYCVAKRANVLRVEAAAAAKEYAGRGVRVNVVSPGMTETKMLWEAMEGDDGEGIRGMMEATPLKRSGTAEEMAEAVEFVVKCKYVNGTDVLVDGGYTAAQRWGAAAGESWKFLKENW